MSATKAAFQLSKARLTMQQAILRLLIVNMGLNYGNQHGNDIAQSDPAPLPGEASILNLHRLEGRLLCFLIMIYALNYVYGRLRTIILRFEAT
jgi:hypothetical protein